MHAGVIENRQTGTMTYLFVFYIKRFKVLTECRAKLQLQNSATFFLHKTLILTRDHFLSGFKSACSKLFFFVSSSDL